MGTRTKPNKTPSRWFQPRGVIAGNPESAALRGAQHLEGWEAGRNKTFSEGVTIAFRLDRAAAGLIQTKLAKAGLARTVSVRMLGAYLDTLIGASNGMGEATFMSRATIGEKMGGHSVATVGRCSRAAQALGYERTIRRRWKDSSGCWHSLSSLRLLLIPDERITDWKSRFPGRKKTPPPGVLNLPSVPVPGDRSEPELEKREHLISLLGPEVGAEAFAEATQGGPQFNRARSSSPP